MVALAEVNYTDNSKRKIDVLAKHTETKGNDWGNEAFKESSGKWKVQVVKNENDTNNNAIIKSFAVTTKENTMYHITICNCNLESTVLPEPSPTTPPAKWHVRVVKGEITGGGETKNIKLTSSTISGFSEEKQLEKLDTNPTNILPSDGFAFLTTGNKILFLMKGKTKEDDGNNKNIVAVFQFKVDNSDKNLKVLPVDFPVECYSPFFQWNGEIIIAPALCQDQKSHNVKMFNKTKNTFNDIDKPIARLRDFFKDKKYFTTAKIDGNDVFFCFQQKDEEGKKNVYLWISDGTRVSNVGTIVENIAIGEAFYGSVLHTEKELITLHQKYKTDENGQKVENEFSLKRLPDQLKNITDTLGAWKNNINKINQLCGKTDKQNIICTKAPTTDGLVGFLHNTLSEENSNIIWKDEYYYSNVIVEKTRAENVENGLKFNGAGKGAEWSMRKQNDNFLYNFINFGFTLVATVTITNNTSNNKNSIFGVSLTNTKNNVGLWCTTDGKWGVSSGDGLELKKSENEECKQGNTYNVALVLETQNLDIYVNGEKLTTEIKKFETLQSITHFYFGVENKPEIESHMTVSNVLLYNRPFTGEEIAKLKEYMQTKKIVLPPAERKTTTAQEHEVSPTQLPLSTDEKTEKKQEKEDVPSPSRTEDGGVGGGVRVFSLLLAVLCVSAPLLHL